MRKNDLLSEDNKRQQQKTAEPPKETLLNAEYTNLEEADLLENVMRDVREHRGGYLVFLNVDVVMKIEEDPDLAQAVSQADYTVADGMPLIWISRLFRRPLKEKISGSDFVPRLCAAAARENKTVFLAGGREDVLLRATNNLKKEWPDLSVAGMYAPPFGFENHPEEIEKMNDCIRAAKPDILILCLGCPKQEKYIAQNREKYQAGMSICAGATVDFLAGEVKRCPPWMSRCGLEWFFRFLQEPRRLFKRYFIDDIQIVRLIYKYRNQSGFMRRKISGRKVVKMKKRDGERINGGKNKGADVLFRSRYCEGRNGNCCK